MELETIIDDREFKDLFKNTGARIRDLTPAMKRVGWHVAESVDKNFQDEGRPGQWRPLAPATLAEKKPGRKILEGDTGRLRQGIHVEDANHNSVSVAPDKLPYARIHQLGGDTGRGLSVTIPARPYLVLQPEDGNEIREIIADYIMRRQ